MHEVKQYAKDSEPKKNSSSANRAQLYKKNKNSFEAAGSRERQSSAKRAQQILNQQAQSLQNPNIISQHNNDS